MRLIDCFIELVGYVSYFIKKEVEKQPPYDQVRSNIERLIAASKSRSNEGAFAADTYDQARFAIFAWVDEMILSSTWQHKGQWQGEQLQRTYFQTTDAGEIFFDRLNALTPHQNDVREVYYFCLAMGFMGRYCHEGDEYLLDQLRTSNLKLLTGSSVGIPSPATGLIFPEAYATDAELPGKPQRKSPFSLSTVLFAGFPLVLFGTLFFIYRFILHNVGEGFIKMVP